METDNDHIVQHNRGSYSSWHCGCLDKEVPPSKGLDDRIERNSDNLIKRNVILIPISTVKYKNSKISNTNSAVRLFKDLTNGFKVNEHLEEILRAKGSREVDQILFTFFCLPLEVSDQLVTK